MGIYDAVMEHTRELYRSKTAPWSITLKGDNVIVEASSEELISGKIKQLTVTCKNVGAVTEETVRKGVELFSNLSDVYIEASAPGSKGRLFELVLHSPRPHNTHVQLKIEDEVIPQVRDVLSAVLGALNIQHEINDRVEMEKYHTKGKPTPMRIAGAHQAIMAHGLDPLIDVGSVFSANMVSITRQGYGLTGLGKSAIEEIEVYFKRQGIADLMNIKYELSDYVLPER